LDYPILSDPGGKVATQFGIYLADRKFSGRKTFYIGKDGKILHIDQKVNVGRHGSDVAEQLGKLGIERAGR